MQDGKKRKKRTQTPINHELKPGALISPRCCSAVFSESSCLKGTTSQSGFPLFSSVPTLPLDFREIKETLVAMRNLKAAVGRFHQLLHYSVMCKSEHNQSLS